LRLPLQLKLKKLQKRAQMLLLLLFRATKRTKKNELRQQVRQLVQLLQQQRRQQRLHLPQLQALILGQLLVLLVQVQLQALLHLALHVLLIQWLLVAAQTHYWPLSKLEARRLKDLMNPQRNQNLPLLLHLRVLLPLVPPLL
jgi:hypothetical protein